MACNRSTQLREPLTLSLTSDGITFDTCVAVVNTTAPKRYCGSAKSFGPSYPQARAVVGAGEALDGLWIVYSVNKEDIGVTRVPFQSLPKAHRT